MKVTMKTNLSKDSINKLIRTLEQKQKEYPTVLKAIADELADSMYNEVMGTSYNTLDGGNPYVGTEKSVETTEDTAIAKISVESAKAYFNEFGTGIKGAESPSINTEYIAGADSGDTVSYRNTGWWYPTDENDQNVTKRIAKDGTLIAFTEGIPAKDGYYKALKKTQEKFKEVATKNINKSIKGD